jgi:hypothetical protein
MSIDKRSQLSAKNKTDRMPNNASCKRWDTPKNVFDLRRCAVVHNLHVIARLLAVTEQAA